MITKDNKGKLFDGVITEEVITTKKLNDYGFNLDDINKLVELGFIVKTEEDIYSLKSINELYSYGIKLLNMKEKDKANLCFEKCYEINPDDIASCFRIFVKSILIGDYNKRTFNLLEKLYSNNALNKEDYNYYLYLLNLFIDIPSKYKDYVRQLKLEDIIVINNSRYNDIVAENKVRDAVISGKYSYAFALLRDELMPILKKIR